MPQQSGRAATSRRNVVLDVEVRDPTWFRPIRGRVLEPGERTRQILRIPQGDAQRLLRSTVRFVADIPPDSSPEVVWVQGAAELLVHTDSIALACSSGLISVGVRVACDQIDGPATITVPFAVGTEAAPSGLVMHGLQRLTGPAVVTSLWSEAITAFAWEAILELARRICAGIGSDALRRPLVPGSIGAAPRILLVQPMARHDLRLRMPS